MGDPALERLVVEQYDAEHLALRRYLVFAGIDQSTAQEIVQETFLRLHRHLVANGARTNLRGWIYRVAHNLARSEQTSARNRFSSSLEGSPAADLVASPGDTPEAQLLLREREQKTNEAIARLTPAQRNCLLLRARGLKYREIAVVLDISVSTVCENVQRGLANLREVL